MPGVAGAQLATMCKGDMELDDEMAVPRRVDRPARRVAPLHESGQGHAGELALRRGLLDACPQRCPLGGVLPDREGVQEEEPLWIRERGERIGRPLVLSAVAPLEQRRVAVKEVELRIDGHKLRRYLTTRPSYYRLARSFARERLQDGPQLARVVRIEGVDSRGQEQRDVLAPHAARHAPGMHVKTMSVRHRAQLA